MKLKSVRETIHHSVRIIVNSKINFNSLSLNFKEKVYIKVYIPIQRQIWTQYHNKVWNDIR